jgi:hypothetical protein
VLSLTEEAFRLMSNMETVWRPVPATADAKRIRAALEAVFKSSNVPLHGVLELYGTPEGINGLLDWTAYENPWRVTAFVMRYGLGMDGKVYTLAEIAATLKRSVGATQSVFQPSPLRNIHVTLLRAHQELRHASGAAARRRNEFRHDLGLKPPQWAPMVKRHIFTVDELCELTVKEFSALHKMGARTRDVIIQRLESMGRTLR